MKIIQITDPHLQKEKQLKLLGIETYLSFQKVCQQIKKEHNDASLIIVTGDISQDSSEQSYQLFKEQILSLNKEYLVLPGNHDEISKLKTLQDLEYPYLFKTNNNWQFILLNSQIENEIAGEIKQTDFAKLEKYLKTNMNTLIFLHHNPIDTNAAWLNQHSLRNKEQFINFLSDYKNIKGVFYGHVHQQTAYKKNDINFFATPSTCFGFAKDSKDFSLSLEKPSYRVIEIKNNKFVTSVHEVKSFTNSPKIDSQGY